MSWTGLSRRAAIGAGLLLAAAGGAPGQEPQAVFVSFTFKAPEFVARPGPPLTGMTTAQRVAAEAQIGAALAKVLGSRFPYWSFKPGRIDAVPRLSVWVEKARPDWEVRMALVGFAGEPGEVWRGRLFAPGDLERFGGLPAPESYPDAIRAAFDENLVADRQKETILGVLQEAIPLGGEVVPAGPLPPAEARLARSVLPLDWDKYCRLAKSEFRVIYRWASEGEVTLHSVGVVGHLPYRSGNPVFEGIAIKHNEWEFGGSRDPIDRHLGDLGKLTPVSFYLKKFNTPNEVSGACSAVDAPRLSVAP